MPSVHELARRELGQQHEDAPRDKANIVRIEHAPSTLGNAVCRSKWVDVGRVSRNTLGRNGACM